MPFRNHRRPAEFRRELEQVASYHRRRAGVFRSQASRPAPDGRVNEELRACRLKIAALYQDLADLVENRLFREW